MHRNWAKRTLWTVAAVVAVAGARSTGTGCGHANHAFGHRTIRHHACPIAYLSVVIGLGVNQDRVRELKFEAKPFILNNGETPAYNVRVRIKAEILTDVQIPNFVKRRTAKLQVDHILIASFLAPRARFEPARPTG